MAYTHYEPNYKGPGVKAFVSIERYNGTGGLVTAAGQGEAPTAVRAVRIACLAALRHWEGSLVNPYGSGRSIWVRSEVLQPGRYQRCRLEMLDGAAVSKTSPDCSLDVALVARLHDTAVKARHSILGYWGPG